MCKSALSHSKTDQLLIVLLLPPVLRSRFHTNLPSRVWGAFHVLDYLIRRGNHADDSHPDSFSEANWLQLSTLDPLASVVESFSASAETVIESQGDSNSGIMIKNTDLKAAAKDFILTNGATADAFHVE